MRLNRLRLSNFRQHIDTRIDFDAGITGIIGPNGSGKSTILEAIAWALYGTVAARGTRESIRSYRAAPRASVRVELEFELGGHRYLVSRGLTGAELFLDGATAPIATSISGVSDLLRRRLGMSHEEFFNTYFTGQKELGVMAAMGPADRAKFLSRVLGYERLRDAQDLVRKRRGAVESEMKGLRAGMPEPEAVHRALADAEAQARAAQTRGDAARARCESTRVVLAEMTPRWEAIQRERDALQALVAELRVVQSERAASERDLARIERECAEVTTAREELERVNAALQSFDALQAELRELERACNEAARRATLNESLRLLDEEIARLAERKSKIETAPALEHEAAAEATRVRAELESAQAHFEELQTEWVRDKQEAETKRRALLDHLRDVEAQREQIIEVGENGTCPICARPLGTHLRSVLEVLDNQIDTIKVDGKYYRARIEQLATTPPEVAALDEHRRQLFEQVAKMERRLMRVQAAVQELATLAPDLELKTSRRSALAAELATTTPIPYDAARHAAVRTEVARLTPLSARATKLATQIERESQLDAERQRVRIRLADIDARLADFQQRRDGLAFSEEAFVDLRGKYEHAFTAFRTAELDAARADSDLKAARGALEAADRARAELARAETQLAELSRERRLHDELDRAFGDIRTDLNQDMRPELSDRASSYIRELTDGRYSEIELDDQYNILVLEDAIPKPVISGGEEDLANLVLRLAISEMIAERAGQAFSLLILDEVFGSLDETRRHNVVDLLRRLQDRFEQVILITHIESVREGLDRVITVHYDEENGTSRVETELPNAEGATAAALQAGAAD
jgi:exonuclease SbcC